MVNYFHHFGESNLGTLLSGERGGVARESLLADTQHSPNSKLLNRAQSSIHLISKFKIKTVRKDILWHIIRGLPWEFGRNLDFNIFSRKLAFICKKTCPKRWDYFRTEITTFSRSNLRKTAFSRVFIMSFSCYSLLNRFVHISCNFGPSTLGIWRNLTWPDLGTTLKPRLKMWSNSPFRNNG